MKITRLIMGMPVTVEIVDKQVLVADLEKIFSYFVYVDETFSPFKETSELTNINRGLIKAKDFSPDMKTIFALAEKIKEETNGFFDIIDPEGKINPSGVVKGWAIYQAAEIIEAMGFKNFYVNAGGDIEARGKNEQGKYWSVGIKNPFNQREIVKTVYLKNCGIATSGTYIRGQHIYNPFTKHKPITEIVSLTVIGHNVYEADRLATPAFAMGRQGIMFIENWPGVEGYLIDNQGVATMTQGFESYTNEPYV